MEKAHVAARAGGTFCGVRRQIFGRFYTVLFVAVTILGRVYEVLPVAASKIGFLSVIGKSLFGSTFSGPQKVLSFVV